MFPLLVLVLLFCRIQYVWFAWAYAGSKSPYCSVFAMYSGVHQRSLANCDK